MAINKSKKELVDLLFTLSPDAITGIVKNTTQRFQSIKSAFTT